MAFSKKYVYLTALSVAIVGCAGYQNPETFESKMARFKNKDSNKNIIPKYETTTFKFRQKRGPASASHTGKKADSSYSNKKLYFMTLYTQYEKLKSHTGHNEAPKVQVCPSFHTALVEYKEENATFSHSKGKFSAKYNLSELSNSDYVSLFPELHLPVSEKETHPKVISLIKKTNEQENITKIVDKAVQIHLSKTFKEITELCEHGSSDNYYAYANLITEVNRSGQGKLSPNPSSVNTLLKTSIYFNHALIESFGPDNGKFGRSIASTEHSEDYLNYVNYRLNVDWLGDYFAQVKSLRSNYSKKY